MPVDFFYSFVINVIERRYDSGLIDDVMFRNLYIAVYFLFLFVGAAALCMMGVDYMDAFSASISNLGNVGPGFGNVGALDNFSQIPVLGKFILAAQMLLGRLEIYSLIIMFSIWKWR